MDEHARDVDDAVRLDGDGCIFDIEDLYEEDRADISIGEDDDDGFVLEDDVGDGPSGPAPLKYNGGETIPGLPTRAGIVRDTNGGISDGIRKQLSARKEILFMPHDVEETVEYVDGVPTYRLNLFGPMMDGSKAHVIIEDIDVFFDIRVPDRPPSAQLLSSKGRERLEKINPKAVRLRQFDAHLRQLFEENAVATQTIDDMEAFPVQGYRLEKCAYKRVFTSDLKERKKAIAAVRSLGYETASDDRSAYYRKAAREYGLTLTEWLRISEYEYVEGPTKSSPLCAHVFRVSVKTVRPLIDPMAPKDVREKASAFKRKNPLLAKDRTFVLTWDIETHSDRKVGEVPNAANPEDHVFMICATAHWKDSTDSLAKICIVDKATDPDERWTTIECGTQENVIKAWFLVLRALAPDSIIGFNDSEYDWPFVIEKANQFELLAWAHEKVSAIPRARQTNEGVYRWNFHREKKIKISPEESFYSSFLKLPGFVPIDVRPCFKKLYPKSEVAKGSSLNFYLTENKLSGKADMPYMRMFKIYEKAVAAAAELAAEAIAAAAFLMRQVAHYCIIDALRCQQLMVRRNVINDYREVSALSYVSFADSVLYAGGMKVCNMLIAYAIRKGMVCSNITREVKETGKYPGAWVFDPEKGLENKRPVTGLDAQSLYPSIIMTYNLSPEKILLTEEEAEYWKARGRKLHYIEFMFNGRQIRGWSIRHNNVKEDIGLYPSILIDLFAKRKEMKDTLAPLTDFKEFIELVMGNSKKEGITLAQALRAAHEATENEMRLFQAGFAAAEPGSDGAKDFDWKLKCAKERIEMVEKIIAKARSLEPEADADIEAAKAAGAELPAVDDESVRLAILAEYDRVCFEHTGVDSKQKALKVFMNTFYGEAGNSLSAFFLLQLAGGVTTAGQHTIKLVANFAIKESFRVKYGDTDSVYLIIPEKYFADVDARYAGKKISKEEYWTEMVQITMKVMAEFRDRVNKMLETDNGTKYLKMAYEEVLFPVVFTGKKKYYGIPHINVPNFHPKKLFVRGIDILKQGQTGLARDIGNRIMGESMKIDNTKTLRQIVEDTVGDAVMRPSQWKFDHFVRTDAYKPNKKNVRVLRFIARMQARHTIEVEENRRRVATGLPPLKYLYKLPEPGERFEYVYVKHGGAFDLQGYRSRPKKGDVMEFPHVCKALGMEIDTALYMESYVVGLCARFINGDADFAPDPAAVARMDPKQIDKKAQDKAKKFLENFIKRCNNEDPKVNRSRGYAYRRAYQSASAIINEELTARIGADADLLSGGWISFRDFTEDEEIDAGDDTDAPANSATAMDGTSRCVERLVARARELASQVVDGQSETEIGRRVTDRLGIAQDGSDKGSDKSSRRLYGVANSWSPAKRPGGRTAPSFHQRVMSVLDRKEAQLRREIVELLPTISEIAMKFEIDLERLVGQCRAEEHRKAPDTLGEYKEGDETEGPGADVQNWKPSLTLEPSDGEAIARMRRSWLSLVGIFVSREYDARIQRYLTKLKNKRLGVVTAPTKIDVKKIVAAAAKKVANLDLPETHV